VWSWIERERKGHIQTVDFFPCNLNNKTFLHYLEWMKNPDLVVIGSGFFGSTIANLAANELGLKVLILEKRNHVGGNAYSEKDPLTGIEIHKYGSHIFHTNQKEIWEYIHQFTEINTYRHKVQAIHAGQNYDFPINLSTLSKFFDLNYNPESARDLFADYRKKFPTPKNFEEKAISMVGFELYDAFIKNYTYKQWQVDPKKLPSSIISRIPTRTNFNSDYFEDKYQGIPIHGYTNWITRMLEHENISMELGIDFFKTKDLWRGTSLVVYTGPIDRYYNYEFGHLGWRTIDFELERLDLSDYQGVAVMNYPDLDVNFTRIHEFKHLTPSKHVDQTLIMREYSRLAEREDEPYYPINTSEDRLKLSRYKELASREKGVFFGGRLGSYKYLDMHMAIASARTMFQNQIRPIYV
jgi:UDP-galactopyranose mutase